MGLDNLIRAFLSSSAKSSRVTCEIFLIVSSSTNAPTPVVLHTGKGKRCRKSQVEYISRELFSDLL